MLKASSVAIATVFWIWMTAPAQLFAQQEAGTKDYISINGINYYFEIHGEGDPLLLLHGGLGSIDMLEPVLPVLAESRQVIGVDLHGHGRTELGDRPISYVDMGDDIAALLAALGYSQVDVMGYSMGGGVALRVAVQNPDLVRRLVVVSAGFSHPDGTYPEILQQQEMIGAEMAETMKGTPMYESYMELAPNPEDFPSLLDRIGETMDRSFDWSEDVKALAMPVMLIYGDSDMLLPEHIIKFYQLLGGGLKDAGWQREHMSQNRLAILPNLTHYDIFLAPELAHTALPFLNGEYETRNWGGQVQESGNQKNK